MWAGGFGDFYTMKRSAPDLNWSNYLEHLRAAARAARENGEYYA